MKEYGFTAPIFGNKTVCVFVIRNLSEAASRSLVTELLAFRNELFSIWTIRFFLLEAADD